MTGEALPCKKLLIVEDNEVFREGLAVILAREGYDVVKASNGKEALDRLRDGPAPDLILLDMLMPVMDGWQFLDELREQPLRVPVVIMTSGITTRDWAHAHGAGYVRKPIEVEALLDEVRHSLGR